MIFFQSFFSSFNQPQHSCAFKFPKLCCYWLKDVQNVGICGSEQKKRCSRLKNIIIYRVEEPENNIHHDQEESCWNTFTNFFKNVKYTILGVTIKATIVWAIVYVIAIIINCVGDSWESKCEEGKFFQTALLLIAIGVRHKDCEQKRAKSSAIISCCIFNIC